MAKKGNDDNEKMENPGRRVPRDAPKTEQELEQAADDKHAAQMADLEPTQKPKTERRQTYGIARQPDGGVFLNIGSEEMTLTEEEWLRLVANASAGGAGNDRIPALMDFHRSEGDVGFVNKG